MPTPALGPRFTACKIAEVSRISQPMRFARINCTQQTGARRPPQQADPLQPGQSARKRAPYRTFSRAWAFCPTLYRRTHQLLREAKLARWKISRTTADDQWRLTSPTGALVTIAGRPTLRALLDAERCFECVQRANTGTS